MAWIAEKQNTYHVDFSSGSVKDRALPQRLNFFVPWFLSPPVLSITVHLCRTTVATFFLPRVYPRDTRRRITAALELGHRHAQMLNAMQRRMEREDGQRHGNIGSLATGQRMTTNQILSRREGAPLQGWAGGSEVDAGRRRGPRRHPLCSRKIHPLSSSILFLPWDALPTSTASFFLPLPSLAFCLLCPTPLSTSRQVFVSFLLPSFFFFFSFYEEGCSAFPLCLYLSFGRM